MMAPVEHRLLAEALERTVLDAPALTAVQLRQGAAAWAAGGPAITAPYDALARQIGEAAHRVTDEQVQGVRLVAGSDKAAFEIIAAAAIGAGLLRWKLGARALGEASNAAE